MKAQPTYITCQWCMCPIHKSRMNTHLRDTGELTLRPVDACVVLFDIRNSGRTVEGA